MIPKKPRDEWDFVDYYLYHTGLSEIPPQFHLWAALSLLSATVADRVWIERDRANRLYPNLYVFLIGPSGSGKEKAINTAVKFVADLDWLRVYAGMATKQAIIEYFAIGAERVDGFRDVVNPQVYFVTEELGMAMRPGELAHDLLTLMTGMYVRPPIPIIEGTRTSGFVRLVDPLINWLAGTTDEWLLKSIPKDAIQGGFFARVIGVRGRRNYTERYASIVYPEDYDEVRGWLQHWVHYFTRLEGSFHISPEAQAYHDKWYESRPAPDDAALEPSFNRSDEMVHRIALLLAIAEQTRFEEPVDRIEAHHFADAINLYEGVSFDVPFVMRLTAGNAKSSNVEHVAEIVRRAETIDRSSLLKKVGNKGMDKGALDDALSTLVDRGDVEGPLVWSDGHGKPFRYYKWTGGTE